jgi:hypothetical protein
MKASVAFGQSNASSDSLLDDRSYTPRNDHTYIQQTDMVEVLRSYSEEKTQNHSRRLTRWQVFVFLIACFRICLINFFDVTNDQTAVTDELEVKQMT